MPHGLLIRIDDFWDPDMARMVIEAEKNSQGDREFHR